jgi:hypothetical protein
LSVDSSGTCCLWDEASCQHLGSAVVGELQGGFGSSVDSRAAVLVSSWATSLLLLLLLLLLLTWLLMMSQEAHAMLAAASCM